MLLADAPRGEAKIPSLHFLNSGRKVSSRQRCRELCAKYAKPEYGGHKCKKIINDAYGLRSAFSHGERADYFDSPCDWYMKFVVLDVVEGIMRERASRRRATCSIFKHRYLDPLKPRDCVEKTPQLSRRPRYRHPSRSSSADLNSAGCLASSQTSRRASLVSSEGTRRPARGHSRQPGMFAVSHAS